jgi:uncharacterized protein (TIGR02687 family)
MNNQVADSLRQHFEKYRIIFWYDEKKELRADFDSFSLSGVEKIELLNNEFGVKYRILREEPSVKFLLYREGARPDDLSNWLLDVELSNYEFRTDQAAVWLAELGLGLEFLEVVTSHTEFCKSAKRMEDLKGLLDSSDTLGRIRLKMLAVCAGSDVRLDSVLENLLGELSEDRDEKIRLILRCNLDSFLWDKMNKEFAYSSSSPGISDFAVELFKSCYAMGTDGDIHLRSDALVFLRRWKDNRHCAEAFRVLSDRYAGVLGIRQDLESRDFEDLMELDYFRLIELKIISDLVRSVVARTISDGKVNNFVRQRRQSYWYSQYSNIYEAIDYATHFLSTLDSANLNMDGLVDGVERYCGSWFKLDQFYRKYVFFAGEAQDATLLNELSTRIDNFYSNNYLLGVNNNWQRYVDSAGVWDASPVLLQRRFFEKQVKPFLKKSNKVCVVISDAMRYEVGDELLTVIRREDRYTAELSPVFAMLPSYTQLGMAALLPNTELTLTGDQSASVLVDGVSSMGKENRIKILKGAVTATATAVRAEELLQLNRDECRDLIKAHDLVYIYHNRIDKTGDKRESEGDVFKAVNETLQELLRVVKKLSAANVSNILVTADHGFIYQNQAIDESDFSGGEADGEQILYRDRRFVLGRGLLESSSLCKFKSDSLGLAGDMEVLVPKSINRLRLRGSGSRFVHGGASLQEVVIPLLKIKKKRQSDVRKVEVEILRGSNSIISAGQLAVMIYQIQPVTDKVQPRELRAGIYTQDDRLISDSHNITFDMSSENPRERELQLRLLLTREADDANGQEVFLKLEEKYGNTSTFVEYKSVSYTLRRSFTSDFDF